MLDAILNPRRLAVIGASDSLAQLSVFAAEHADSIDSIDIDSLLRFLREASPWMH